MNIDEQRLRAAMEAVDPVDADESFARQAAHEGSRRNRRNRTLAMVGGLSAVAVVAALSTPLWLLDRGPATIATPSPEPTVTSSPTPTVEPTPPPTPSPSAVATQTPSPSAVPAGVTSERLITSQGVGVLRVGMTIEEGITLGIATDQGEMCGPWEMTEAGYERYPGVWAYWTGSGLGSLAVTSRPEMDATDVPGLEYATAEGIRVRDTLDAVREAYGDRAIPWKSDREHWASIDDLSLPSAKIRGGGYQAPDWELEGILVRDGDQALVFLGRDGVVDYIMATSINGEGKTQVVHGC